MKSAPITLVWEMDVGQDITQVNPKLVLIKSIQHLSNA